MNDELDCHALGLVGRMLQICQGTSGLPEAVRQDYITLWTGESNQMMAAVACKHRGNRTSTIGCGACDNGVQIAVYDCTIHEECTIEPVDNSVLDCRSCPDRNP